MKTPKKNSSTKTSRRSSGSQRVRLGLGIFLTVLCALLLAKAPGWMLSGTVGAQSPSGDLAFDTEDVDFILNQIKFSERHAAGEELADILPNLSIPWGLRTVDGSFNNLIPGQELFGSADQEFPALNERVFVEAQELTFPLHPDDVVGASTSYAQGDGTTVQDSTPRLISHMIVNQSVDNPAARFAAAQNEDSENIGPDITGIDQLLIPNVAVDEGLSAPTNAFITFFGQFFDHGLDLVNKGGNGVVFMPLQEDDPLFDDGPDNIAGNEDDGPNFMLLTRSTRDAGPDGIIGTADDVLGPVNATTPHVDQQQTYASHSSSQVFLRHYEFEGGVLQDSGRLLNGFGNDGLLDTADDGGMATWDTVQLQALTKMGIDLDDLDGNNVPMIAADQYGNFIPGPVSGLPQIVTLGGPIEGDLGTPIDASLALRVNQSYFIDVAHSAAPNGPPDSNLVINERIDTLSGQTVRGIRATTDGYDDELLGAHFMCGDGRCNENIALTSIHTIFHSEHNRLAYLTKRVVIDAGDLARLNEWLDTPVLPEDFPVLDLNFTVADASLANQATTAADIDALGLDWNGKRIFQAARFGTEMQYNRIVFDEFSPTLAGLKDVFEGFHTNVEPDITFEFSQSVYRFGHSMLTSTVDRYDPDFGTIVDPFSGDGSQLGLFEAFLNPLALFNYSDALGENTLSPEQGVGAVIRGITRTRSNEIDEFVTGAMQNNLVGLPLDIGAINIARGRDVGNPRLNDARRMFFDDTMDTRLAPYVHWADYADNLRHEPSLVNFVAAYGTHPTLAGPDGIIGNTDDPVSTFVDRRAAACAIVGALTVDGAAFCAGHGFAAAAAPADSLDFLFSAGLWASVDGRATTGLEDVDFWNGGLAEERMPFGGYLGSTHNYIFETQLEHLQNGDRFYYVGRTATIHLFGELESNSFTALVMRNTDLGEPGAGALPLNIFSIANHYLEVDQSEQFNGLDSADPDNEEELTPLVIRDASRVTTNIFIPDLTRLLQYTGGDHVVLKGTEFADTLIGGIGDDAIWGLGGDDRIEGGDGADLVEGGSGDDIITDLSGPDVIEGGDGNDAIYSGNEEDVIFGDAGHDFIVNPSEFGEIFAGLGNDYIFDGEHLGHIRGGAGNDWMENVGGGEDLFQADNGAAPEAGEPSIKGHDVFIAHGGNNDADMENGDDIIVDGPGIDRAEGQLGFDWISFQNDTFGVNVDLDLTIFLRPRLPPSNDTIQNRYDRVEGISGSMLADILRGTPNQPGTEVGNGLTLFDVEGLGFSPDAITGIGDIVPASERGDLPPDPTLTTGEAQFGWDGGEIILGGGGSDLVFPEGGDDIVDGDSALTVGISTPDPAIRMGPVGQALRAAKQLANTTASQAALDQAAVDGFGDAVLAAAAAVTAAEDADMAAMAAAAVQEAAQSGMSAMTISDAIGNLITAAVVDFGTDITGEWQTFLNSCSEALADTGFMDVSTADSAAQAAAELMAAETAALSLSILTVEAAAAASAIDAATAAAALITAQAAMVDADVTVIVPGMQEVMAAVFGGFINPGELSISRVIADSDLADTDTDAVVYTGNEDQYTIDLNTPVAGFTQVTDTRAGPFNEGRDLLRNIERVQFADGTVELVPGTNSLATGQPAITPSVGIEVGVTTLTALIGTVMDADNVISGGAVDASMVDWTWQVELEPGSGDFEPIVRDGGFGGNGDPFEATGDTLAPSAAEAGLQVRVVGIFQDEALVFETVTSAPVTVGTDGVPPAEPFVSIRAATFIPQAGLLGRLRVTGNVEPSVLFVAVFGNTDCTGAPLGFAELFPADLEFGFDALDVPDPGNVCVSASFDGPPIILTASAPTVAEVVPAECGDGILDLATEECDDGNLDNGDGCSAACIVEPAPGVDFQIDRRLCRVGRGRLIVRGVVTGVALPNTATLSTSENVTGGDIGTTVDENGAFRFRSNNADCDGLDAITLTGIVTVPGNPPSAPFVINVRQ